MAAGRTNLLVHGGHDGGADLHAQDEAALEVLLEEHRLEDGHQNQQHRVHVAVPVRGLFVLGEGDHQPEIVGEWSF